MLLGSKGGVRIGAVVSDHGAGGEGVHGGADVLIDEVAVDGDGGRGTFTGGGDDLGARVGDVAGDPDAADAGRPVGAGGDPAVLVEGAAQADQQVIVGDEPRWDEQRRPRN